jgi:predicted deacylase
VFPGQKEGSITEQIAFQITQQLISRADYFLDMHAGDAPEDLRPSVGYYQANRFAEASNQGKQMALAMGFDHILVFNVADERLDQPSQYCSQEAFHRGIPVVDIECGGLGTAAPQAVNKITDGVLSLLRHLDMLDGEPIRTESPIIISERTSVLSEVDGIFYPTKKGGDYVNGGMKVGQITDFFGRHLTDVRANASGIILYIMGTPPIQKGETILRIGLTVAQ